MVSLPQEFRPDPYTSVLVVNVGALRGKRCPDAHWIYVPDSDAGFFRVGFYSNVDSEFVPASSRAAGDRVSIYVEKAYPGGAKPTELEQQRYVQAVIAELQSWGFIGDVEVAHGTWVDSAYTWSWPGSRWRRSALELLAQHGVQMVGRYARWHFQGIAESIGDGLVCGAVERWV